MPILNNWSRIWKSLNSFITINWLIYLGRQSSTWEFKHLTILKLIIKLWWRKSTNSQRKFKEGGSDFIKYKGSVIREGWNYLWRLFAKYIEFIVNTKLKGGLLWKSKDGIVL
jgi:hypothetical protein